MRFDGDDLRLLPTEASRWALVRLIAGSDKILFNEALVGEGVVVFARTCEMGREGIVSKREDSLYRSGKGPNWLRTKNPTFVRTLMMPGEDSLILSDVLLSAGLTDFADSNKLLSDSS